MEVKSGDCFYQLWLCFLVARGYQVVAYCSLSKVALFVGEKWANSWVMFRSTTNKAVCTVGFSIQRWQEIRREDFCNLQSDLIFIFSSFLSHPPCFLPYRADSEYRVPDDPCGGWWGTSRRRDAEEEELKSPQLRRWMPSGARLLWCRLWRLSLWEWWCPRWWEWWEWPVGCPRLEPQVFRNIWV